MVFYGKPFFFFIGLIEAKTTSGKSHEKVFFTSKGMHLVGNGQIGYTCTEVS